MHEPGGFVLWKAKALFIFFNSMFCTCLVGTPPIPFAVVVLEMGVSLFAQACLDCDPPTLCFLPEMG
jgi:hypothetical protein